ncbi:MAG: hypothetical protein QXQ57_06940 [Sulfolobales archaeon]
MSGRIVIGTDDGLYELREGRIYRICCEGYTIYDAKIYNDELYICSSDAGVLRILGDRVIRVIDAPCWRLYVWNDLLVASVEGPMLYIVREDNAELLADYRVYASKLGWWFPHGPPHITDISIFMDRFAASVEVGNILAGHDLSSMAPLDFSHDQHNLLSLERRLLIATASGVYYTEDLNSFVLSSGSDGYFHALESCGSKVAGHVMSTEPLRISEDHGRTWIKIGLRLPPPTYGTTGIVCIDDSKLIYSTTEVYEIDLDRVDAKKIVNTIPMTRRITKLPFKD